MSFAKKLQDDLVVSMKAREALKTSVLRMVIADLKNIRIEKGSDLTDDDVLGALRSGVKKRRDSVEAFTKGGREELAAKERDEIAILETYLPAQLDAVAIAKVVDEVIAELGSTSKKDMGQVMKAARARLGDRADGRLLSQIVGSRLS